MAHRTRTGVKQKPSPTRGDAPSFTSVQEEVLHLLVAERLTPQEIALRRKTSKSATYQILRQLQRMGIINKDYQYLHKSGIADEFGSTYQWELHGCKWRVEIISGHHENSYNKLIGKGVAQVEVHNCTIELYPKTIKVHCRIPFRSDHPDKCVVKSWDFLWRLLGILENDLKLVLRKERKYNIRRYAGHFPRQNDEIAKLPGAEHIRVYDDDDGKIRFYIDWSPKTIPEGEFPHSQHGGLDAGTYEEFIADLKNPHLPLSEASRLALLATKIAAQAALAVDRQARGNRRFMEGAEQYGEHHKSHIAVIQELGRGVSKLTSAVRKLEQKKPHRAKRK